MFYIEIRRAFSRVSFKISVLIGMVFCIASLIKSPMYTGDILKNYINGSVHAPFDNFIMFTSNPISNLLIIILPLINTLSYSDSYLEDLKSGFIKSIYTRYEKSKYLVSKYCANFIVSGLAFSIPLLINYFVLILLHPSLQPDPILGKQTIMFGGLFPKLFYSRPNLYIMMWITIYFLYSGAFASIALCVSQFIKNKFIVLAIPFTLFYLSEGFAEIVNKMEYSPESFLYLYNDQHFSIIILEFVIITTITFIVFCIGGLHNENY